MAAHAASLGVWDWDLSTNTFFYSERAKQICGFAADAAVTFEQVRDVTHPEDLAWTLPLAQRALDPKLRARDPYRYRIRRADNGEVRWVIAHGEAVFAEMGGEVRATHYIGTLQDITDQKYAEDALAESEARLRLAVEAGKLAVWEIDLDANAITPSPELNRLCGFPADAAPTIAEFRARYAPGEAERIDREAAELQARGETEIQTEFKMILPDSGSRWLLLRAQLAPATERIKHRVIGVLIDITDRKLAEERSEVLAREMQHRVKNTLGVVQALVEQSFRKKDTVESANRAITGRLRALATATQSISTDAKVGVELGPLIEEVIRPYREPDNDPFVVTGPKAWLSGTGPTAVAMSLHELCTNAIKYGSLSQPGGRVEISWVTNPDGVRLSWKERNGPPVISPTRRGFGTRLLEGGLFEGDAGSVNLTFEPGRGTCELRVGS